MSLVAWTIRVDAPRNDKTLLTLIKECFTSYLVVHEYAHITKKPHFHAMVYLEPKGKDPIRNFRQRLLRAMPHLKGEAKGGDGTYALSACRNEQYFREYCCKGSQDDQPDVVECNWMDFDASALRQAYWVRKQKQDNDPEGKTLCWQAMRFWRGHQMFHEETSEEYMRIKVAEWLIQQCVEKEKPIVKNYLRSIVNTVVAANSDTNRLTLSREIALNY